VLRSLNEKLHRFAMRSFVSIRLRKRTFAALETKKPAIFGELFILK
jgi:hypothetical protein